MTAPEADPNRPQHLEFIQAAITRLAENSFLIKGWTVTLVAALFALAANDAQPKFVIIALLPAACFWGLDAYYLRQERLFRALYAEAVKAGSTVPTYSMDTSGHNGEVAGLLGTALSKTLLPFHGSILVAIFIAIVVLGSAAPAS